MDAPSPQTVLDIYTSLTANGQIERFSARDQAAIYRAANSAALYLWRFEQRGEADLPNFGSFAFLMLVGPIDEREETEEDAEAVRMWRTIASDNVPSYLASLNRRATAAAEVARAAADDEREE